MKIHLTKYRYAQIEQIENDIGIDKKTIVSFAIYNGICAIENEFYPKFRSLEKNVNREEIIEVEVNRTLNEKIKKIHADLNERIIELNIAIAELNRKISIRNEKIKNEEKKREKIEELSKISRKRLIEKLVDIEIEKIATLWNISDEEDYENLYIKIKIPKKVKDGVEQLQKEMSLNRNSIQQYIFLNGYQDIINNIPAPYLKNDDELKYYIDNLDIPLIKGWSLAEYILKYKYKKNFSLLDT